MIWKSKSKPKEGEIRARRKFAWLPFHFYIDTEMYYCWLESYQVEEKYTLITTNRGEGRYSSKMQWKIVKQSPVY